MGRRKKEPRSVHRENIVSAASVLFMEKGDLRNDLKIMPAIFNFWGMLSGIIQLAANKEEYIQTSMGLSKKQFWEYGFSIIYDSIAAKEE